MEPINHPDLDDDDKRDDYLSALEHAISTFAFGLEFYNLLKKLSPALCDLLEQCFKEESKAHYYIASEIVDKINFQGHDDKVEAILTFRYVNLITNHDFEMEEGEYDKKRSALISSINMITRYVQQSNTLGKHSKCLIAVCEECLKHDLEEVGYTPMSFWGECLRIVTMNVVSGGTAKNMAPFVPFIMKMLTCDVKEIADMAGAMFLNLQMQPELFTPYIDDVIDIFLNNHFTLLPAIKSAFKEKEEEIMNRFDEIAGKCDDLGSSEKYAMLQLFDEVGKKHPKRVLPYTKHLITALDDFTTQSFAMMAMLSVIPADPKRFDDDKIIHKLLSVLQTNANLIYYADQVIVEIGRLNKGKTEKCMQIFAEQLQNPSMSQQTSTVLMSMKQLAGDNNIPLLAKYKDLILSTANNPSPGIKDGISSIMDLIEGRSLATVTHQIGDIQDDVEDLDQRVTNTEENVNTVDQKVNTQQKEIKAVKTNVQDQGERLDELKDVVDDTVEKVEEIDHKTISAAPAWSRDVSKILNVEDDHDWRFLAIRLGYTSEDIRNWATAHDPTMSLLSEWYTTHKSTDATYAILTSLKDIGRNHCVDIIKRALKAADEMLPQTPPELTHPPPVFISYQWDHQSDVKTLKEHLGKAGYDCWMDIGQMGGGDQLNKKIDEGMRGSKVVLSIVTKKYSESKNCNHEVNLASLLNKPIIPLLLENVSWPPPGPMSVLFSQLLYINFCPKKGYKKGQKFWEDVTFTELLGQIYYHAAPDPNKMTDAYRDWIPKVDNTSVVNQIPKVDNAEKSQQDNISPQVFISYQWDTQSQIKKLFSRLTSQGYTCWLDIMQMGGGDALYGKIDKGIRNAKVIISCCTSKYALSANCRREVSLADTLHKPLIPLLLEPMTWPPEGPMSLPFTQLLYIDFTNERSQTNFDDAKFEELLQQIRVYAKPDTSDTVANTQETMSASPSRTKSSVPSPGSDAVMAPTTEKCDNQKSSSSPSESNGNKTTVPTSEQSQCCTIQ
ncbi:uncharacterized protein LOC144450813 [Glandiceps talaboti]